MVRPKGLEPLAHGLGNRCSILLSYGRMIIPQVLTFLWGGLTVWSQIKRGKHKFSLQKRNPVCSMELLEMVRPEGFEPPTSRFVACHSIQLSYGRRLQTKKYGGERGIRTLDTGISRILA